MGKKHKNNDFDGNNSFQDSSLNGLCLILLLRFVIVYNLVGQNTKIILASIHNSQIKSEGYYWLFRPRQAQLKNFWAFN